MVRLFGPFSLTEYPIRYAHNENRDWKQVEKSAYHSVTLGECKFSKVYHNDEFK